MKGKTKPATKASRNCYSTEFKQQALARAAQDGVATAAKDLGLQETDLRLAPQGSGGQPN